MVQKALIKIIFDEKQKGWVKNMKRILKKILVCILVFVIILNFSFSTPANVTYAVDVADILIGRYSWIISHDY